MLPCESAMPAADTDPRADWQCNEPSTKGKCIVCRCRLPVGHHRPALHICICGRWFTDYDET